LVHDMLQIDPARPETCVALAAMWERKDEKKALTYAEKVYTSLKNFFMEGNLDLMSLQRFPSHQSLRVDDRHITGYIMKVILEDIVPKLVLYYYVNFLLNCIFAKHHWEIYVNEAPRENKEKEKKDVIVGLFALGSSFLRLHDFYYLNFIRITIVILLGIIISIFLITHMLNMFAYCFMKGNLHLSLNRPDLAVTDFRGAQELKSDLRSYQGYCVWYLWLFYSKHPVLSLNINIPSGLVRAYLALSKCKEALFAAREAMKVMHQSAKALKLVGDVHAINSSGRDKVIFLLIG
jgi:hypothetical protein